MIRVGDVIKVDGIDCTVFYIDSEKYWAADHTKLGGAEWGAYGTSVGTSTDFGSGKTNTEACLNNDACFVTYYSDSTIWSLLKTLRETRNSTRWFIGSRDELAIARDIISSVFNFISWTSSEVTGNSSGNSYTFSSSATSVVKSNTRDTLVLCTFTSEEIGASVEITQEDGANIRYTDDDTDPDETDTLYESPISASNGDTIKARAYLNDATLPSDIASVTIDTTPLPKTETIPLGTELEDGYIVFDRGEEYGEYNLSNGKLTRLSDGVDDGSNGSINWRFLIAAKADLPGNDKDEGNKSIGINAEFSYFDGYGSKNTQTYLNLSSANSEYIGYQINIFRLLNGEKWFFPSSYEFEYSLSYIPNLIGEYITLGTNGSINGKYRFKTYSSTGENSTAYYDDTNYRVRLMYRI